MNLGIEDGRLAKAVHHDPRRHRRLRVSTHTRTHIRTRIRTHIKTRVRTHIRTHIRTHSGRLAKAFYHDVTTYVYVRTV